MRTQVINSNEKLIGYIDKFVGEIRDANDITFVSVNKHSGEIRDRQGKVKGEIVDYTTNDLNVVALFIFFFAADELFHTTLIESDINKTGIFWVVFVDF